ncbi:GNAT family N-acetyltransferase [Micromonospora chersina]|uniref:GNAT family N-acetyltransferase n=1 Tax=Micromonospora chersina TaxID=47854 RepID=UPI0033F2AD27
MVDGPVRRVSVVSVRNESGHQVLMREDGEQASFGTADGMAALDVIKAPQGGRLARFVTRTGYERQGRGTAVLAKACAWADERGLRRVS